MAYQSMCRLGLADLGEQRWECLSYDMHVSSSYDMHVSSSYDMHVSSSSYAMHVSSSSYDMHVSSSSPGGAWVGLSIRPTIRYLRTYVFQYTSAVCPSAPACVHACVRVFAPLYA